MGPPWLLLQLAPLVLQATEKVELVQELVLVLYATQERIAQSPTLFHVLLALQATEQVQLVQELVLVLYAE